MQHKIIIYYFSLKKLNIIVTNYIGGHRNFHGLLVAIQMMQYFWKVIWKTDKVSWKHTSLMTKQIPFISPCPINMVNGLLLLH